MLDVGSLSVGFACVNYNFEFSRCDAACVWNEFVLPCVFFGVYDFWAVLLDEY